VASLRAYQAMDLRREVGRIGVPTLVMQRRDDRIVPFEAGRWLARAIPNARFEAQDGADHFLWHGDAAAVAQGIERFIAAQQPVAAAAASAEALAA
jgi:pimeloyl-ACP methyl ester carboxylesterase